MKVTLVGGVANLLLTAFKFFAGIVAGSAAMISDAAHSLSDLATDLVVLIFVKISGKPKDASHEYGHGKYETIATLFISIGIAAAAIAIIVSGAKKFSAWLSGETLSVPGRLALWAALTSIVVKELIFQYTALKGRKLDSKALIANAWHHRSDALSSVGAALGIGGAILLGERWAVLDPIAAVIVGSTLIVTAVKLLHTSMNELTDSSLPPETEKEILGIIESCPGLHDPHQLRTRKIGNSTAIEVHVRMDGDISLREAHEKTSEAESRLKARFGSDAFVTIHMEPVE